MPSSNYANAQLPLPDAVSCRDACRGAHPVCIVAANPETGQLAMTLLCGTMLAVLLFGYALVALNQFTSVRAELAPINETETIQGVESSDSDEASGRATLSDWRYTTRGWIRLQASTQSAVVPHERPLHPIVFAVVQIAIILTVVISSAMSRIVSKPRMTALTGAHATATSNTPIR